LKDFQTLNSYLNPLIAALASSRERRAVLLAGEADWCRDAAESVLRQIDTSLALWVSEHAPTGVDAVPAARAISKLGTETAALVFDAHDGFHPDAFGAAVGTLRGGGLLLILTPQLWQWPDFPDPDYQRTAVYPHRPETLKGRFLSRLSQLMVRDMALLKIEQGRPLPPLIKLPEPCAGSRRGSLNGSVNDTALYRTKDQQRAVEAVLHVVSGHRRRPLVLTSDRGRGKSAALGISAGQLLGQGKQRILVTAPTIEALDPLFEQAARQLPEAVVTRGMVQVETGQLLFVAADELLRHPQTADLLLVDEAAAIPVPILEQLLARFSRVVFATTLHGYEGSGRGFAVRFQQILSQRTPAWRALHLKQPIRWAENDPLESLSFKTLLLDAAPVADEQLVNLTLDRCRFERIDRDLLVQDESLLSELFGLLVQAHYRTTPDDLRDLLDGPNLDIWVLSFRGHVVGTLLGAWEGGFDPALARSVWAGKRRPRGHLLPQFLASQGGCLQAPELNFLRVIRIAIHPGVQGRGLGSLLLSEVIRSAEKKGADLIGSSFGATPDLLRFWGRAGLLPVCLGVSCEASSGTHSAIVIHSINPSGEGLMERARCRFLEQFPEQLTEVFNGLLPDLVVALMGRDGEDDKAEEVPPLNSQDWLDLTAFCFGNRSYESCSPALCKCSRWLIAQPEQVKRLDSTEQALLILKVLQKQSWQKVAKAMAMSGRNAVLLKLRQVLRPWVAELADAQSQKVIGQLMVRGGKS
jgi:tRNA(Met) cytidine acetyltransferase